MITHDRWQRIKEIFQSAQELAPPERSEFLNAACGNDELIREEVEALFTADAGNDDFLSAPAYEFAASLLAAEETEFSAGQSVGRYAILCPLGSGGMGQIYLARDTQLGRKIALKLISPQFASDQRRVHRFEQEARAISALNHPNICVIHEIGMTENGRHFIAMEHIQGSTVRDRLSRGGFTVFEAVSVAVQVAAALASAHASGIVHRDIKPENVMLRPDGYVKVLDFGLAKLVEILPEQQGWRGVTTNLRTEAGTLMGTVKYMSPEQLREADVDERTDIWSLGVVLYEMLVNSTPFEARTSNDTVALILSSQPAPMRFPAELPGKLKAVIAKALEKDADKRYQTVTRLASDLRAVQRELRAAEGESSLLHDEETRELPAGSALITRIKSQAISTADFLISEIRSHKAAAVFAGVTSILVLLSFLPNLLPTKPTAGISALTNSGNVITSAISPDGKVFAHAEEAQGKQRLFVTSIATSSRLEVAAPANVEYLGLVFSRDSNYLYFTRREDGNDALYRLPVMSTSPVRVKDDVGSPIAFSPNGDRFAFVRLNKVKGEYQLVLSNVDGTNEQSLATRANGDKLSVYGLAWSPDGAMVVCPVSTWTDGFHVTLMGFDVNTKSARTLSDQLWFSILQVAWQDDMSGLVISARERETAPDQLWRITYPAGATERLTRDLDEYTGVSLAGNKIVTVKTVRSWSIWVTTLDESVRSSPIAPGTGLTYGITWARDGKIVYSAMTAHGRLNLTRIDPDGSNRVQLTSDAGDNYNPAASADGQFVVFSSNRSGRFNIWRINSNDGSGAQPLTFTDGNFYPSVSPDNEWVAYDRQTDLKLSIWKVPLQGGEPTKLIEGYRMPVFSPDSQLIAGRYDRESGTTDVAIFPAAGGEPLKRFTVPMLDWQRVQWIDGHTLSFISEAGGASNIWTYDLNAGTSKQLTNFDSERIYAYAWSPDLKQLVSQRGHKVSDAMIITGAPISEGVEP